MKLINLNYLSDAYGQAGLTDKATKARLIAEKLTQQQEIIKSQIDKSSSPYEIEKLQERLSKMVGGVAIINVGGGTEIEMKEKKDRLDDAPHALKLNSNRVGSPSLYSGPALPPIRAKNDALRGLSPDFTGGFRFMPSAFAAALPLAFKPPLGF